MNINSLSELQNKLITIYEKTKGIINGNKENTHLEEIHDLLKIYNGEDWREYINLNSCHYHRHTFYTSDEFDLLIITWAVDQECPIHNHPVNGCTVRVMQGNIKEERYKPEDMSLIKTIDYNENNIMYIDDSQAYHKMCNKGTTPCVTLHVYAPGKYKPTYFE